jgi:tetratricopeptide (TPR) repeat protein
MTSEHGGVNRNLTATQHFLFSKTPAEGKHDPGGDTAPAEVPPEIKEALGKQYPGLRMGDAFPAWAGAAAEGAPLFTSLALRIDTVASRDEDEGGRFHRLGMKVADLIHKFCAAHDGQWGLMAPDVFGCVFPGKDVATCLSIVKKLQEQVNTALERTLTVGLAGFPCLTYAPVDVVGNARKALDHAAYLGPGGRACFDAVSLNISGDRYYDNSQVDQAIEEFRNALRLDSQNVNVLNSLGVCFGVKQNYTKALTAFQAALKVNEKEILALYNAGLVNLLMGEKDKALTFWLKAAPLGKDVFELNYQTGKLLLESNRPEKAQPMVLRAAELKPESARVQRLLGDIYLAQRLIDAAIPPYKKALRSHPNDASALSGLGRCYELKNENLDIALAFCQQSVEIMPAEGRFHLRLGRLLKKTGQYQKALEAFKKAETLGENAGDAIRAIEERSIEKAS